MIKSLFFSICLLFIGKYLSAQVAGDYISVAIGVWNNNTNWQQHNGTSFQPATDYPGQVTGTGNVTIANGHSMILTASPAFPIGSLTFQEGDDLADLFINDGFTLNVTGAVLINPPTINVGKIKQVVLNGGTATLNCASITLVPSDDDVRLARIQFRDGGILNVTGDITMGINTPLRTNILFFGGGGTLNIGGSIVGGDITPGSGTVNFNGTGVQILGGVLPKQMYSMGMTNAASTLQLAVNLTLHGTLTLTNGKINTGTNTLTLDNSTPANQLTGGSSSSYVYSTGAGRLRRNNLAPGNLYTFPVGTSTNYLPVGVNTAAGTSEFAVNVFSPATTEGTESGTPFPDKSKIVDAVWNIDRPIGSGNTEVTIQWADVLEGTSFASLGDGQIGISQNNAGTWLPAIATSANAAANIVTATFTTFSPFGVGQIGIALPVKFGALNAYKKQSGIQLDWIVYSEDNVKNYEVERSADARSFNLIGSVNRNSATSNSRNYTFPDDRPLNGKNYYRIRQVDKDGRFSYSPVIGINNSNVSSFIAFITPSPAASVMNLSIEGVKEKETLAFEIMNASGMIVHRENITTGGTMIVKSLQRPAVSAGLYFYKITRSSNNETFSGRLVLQ